MSEELKQTREQASAFLKACEGYENIELHDDESGMLSGTHSNGLPARIAGSDETGWFEVHGGICSEWLLRGGPTGELGLPLSNEEPDPGYRDSHGKRSRFQHGTIHGWPADPNQPKGAWSFATEIEDNCSSLKTPREGRLNKTRWELPPKAAELKKTILSKLDEIDRVASTMLPSEGDLEEKWKESEKEARKIRTEIKPYLDAFDSSTFFIVTFGMLKAGKSTLVNALVGHRDVSPVGHGRETTKRSSIIFAADTEHPEGIYIYKAKGTPGDMPEEVWHKKLCESLILALGGVGRLEEQFDLEGDKWQTFSKESVEKLLTKKPIPGALPPVIRVSPQRTGNLLEDGVAILDTPGLDGLEANKKTDSFWQVLPSQGDFFLLVQSSMSGLNENAAEDVRSIYGATERNPGILIVYNKIVSEFWLKDSERTKKLEKDEEDVETYLRDKLHDVSKGAEVDIVSVNAGAASAALFGNPGEFSEEFSKNPDALLEQSRICDLSGKLRGMLQRSRMQIKIDRLKGLMGQCLTEQEKTIQSKLDEIPKLKADDISKAQKTRKRVSEAMDILLSSFADQGKTTLILTPVADAAVVMFSKSVSADAIEDAVKTESPSGSEDPSRESCREAIEKIVHAANEDCCRGLGSTITMGTSILQTEPWSKFNPGDELKNALDIVMDYLYGALDKDARTKEFLASLFYQIDANSLKAHLSYSTEPSDFNFPRPNFLQRQFFGEYVRRKDWDSHVVNVTGRLRRHYVSKNGVSPAASRLRNFVIDKMKAAGKERSEALQKLVNEKIKNETTFEDNWQKKNNYVLDSMNKILKLEKEIHKAISEE